MIGQTILHYKIIEKLGEGGMGVVYKAEDTKLDRTVAIKFLPRQISTSHQERQRFTTEAKAAAALNHPNIATIYAIEEVDDETFIVMEYVEGQELKNIVGAHRDTPLPIENILNIATQIAEGLQAAHKKGIVHRDIKSANIMLTESGQVKIMDFGLAKIVGNAHLTKLGMTVGTPSYMSPEQTRGDGVDQRTDIWSLGVVLYEMLAGRLPFESDYEQAVIYSILNEEPEPVGKLREDASEELQQVVHKALAKNQTERHKNMSEVIADLKNLSGETESGIGTTKQSAHEPMPSIAVLPFANMSADPEQEYFCDGMSEEIINALTQVQTLRVVARTSAFSFKGQNVDIREIGEKLNVETILEGSVRKAGNQLRITAQLIEVSDGYHLWSERFDRQLDDVFEIQDEIARSVVEKLKVELLGEQQEELVPQATKNMEAYDYFLRGKNYQNRGPSEENLNAAEQMFLRAVELDPDFAIAFTRLAQVSVELYWFYWDRNDERLTLSKDYIDKALKINPNLPEVYLALGHYYYHGLLEYDRALSSLEKGLKIKPDDGEILTCVGFVNRRKGKFEAAIENFKKALQLDPLSVMLNDYIGEAYLLLKQYDEAEEYLNKAISALPHWGFPYHYKAKLHILRDGDVLGAYELLTNSLGIVNQGKELVLYYLVQVQIFSGRYEEALKTLADEEAQVFEDQYLLLPKSQLLATIYTLQEKHDQARTQYDVAREIIELKLRELPDDAKIHSALGIVCAALGEKKKAIEEGELAAALLSITKEAWRGFFRELDLARIYSMVGEYKLAVKRLDYLLSVPGELSVPYLKLDPVWKPLFKLPEFQSLLKKHQ